MPFKDPGRRREYGRDRMKRNAEKGREVMRRWRASHRSEHAAARELSDATHPLAASARRKRYALAHPEVARTTVRFSRITGPHSPAEALTGSRTSCQRVADATARSTS